MVNGLLVKFSLAIYIAFSNLVSVKAQVIPDTSLGNEKSVVTPNQIINSTSSDLIQGGATRNSSLFHSFREFSIGLGQGAYFANPTGIATILARVTGRNRSNLLGKLGVLGSADLFLLNPNGIVFGPNARLDLNGSFLATTADYFRLQDGTIFSGHSAQPLLSIKDSQLIGLGFNGSPGSIEVQGPGHNFVSPNNPFIPPSTTGLLPTGLQLKPNQTLALIGGDVYFEGGVLTSPSGRVVIGSIISGELKVKNALASDLSFNYFDKQVQGNIELARLSMIYASGIRGSNINIFGNNIELTDSSLVLVDNFGSGPGGEITISALNSLDLIGDTQFNPKFPGSTRTVRGVRTQAFDKGSGANININSKELNVDFHSTIFTRTYASGSGGNVIINSSNAVSLKGQSPFTPLFPFGSIVGTTASGSGRAGDVELNTPQLSIQDGSTLQSTAFNNADGGHINVNSKDIDIIGFNPFSNIPSAIVALTSGIGDSGDVSINTNTLVVQDGGRIGASTFSKGTAGNVTVNALDSVKIDGSIPNSVNSSLIDSSANTLDPVTRTGLGVPPIPTGESGSVFIRTRNLEVSNGAEITVKNDGPNNAGQLTIVAKNIKLSDGGSITSSTNGGDGGNTTLYVESKILLKDALLSASAIKNGKGGNIVANADFIIALGRSSITAEAEKNRGGNIFLTAKAVYFSPETLVSVSSDAGLQASGTFRLVVEKQDFNETTAPAPDVLSAPKITSSCNPSGKASKFVVLGSGGLKKDPQSQSTGDLSWKVGSSDLATTSSRVELQPKASLMEAKGWRRLEDGTVKLTATPQDSSSKVAAHPTPCTHPLKQVNSKPSA